MSLLSLRCGDGVSSLPSTLSPGGGRLIGPELEKHFAEQKTFRAVRIPGSEKNAGLERKAPSVAPSCRFFK
jgi:hypothetical protein